MTTTPLFETCYDELRAIARARLARERADHTHAATSLVHEVYVKLGRHADAPRDRKAFLALAARAMRNVLVDSARRRLARPAPATGPIEPEEDRRAHEYLRLDVALEALAERDPALHRIVEARYFLGMDVETAARELGISTATVKRGWRAARAFLESEIGRDDGV